MASKRVWVVGDIHGMFDPLNRLLRRIRLIEQQRGGEYAMVFLGDYIDYGPSSREVLDALIELSATVETVFLAGNHEDLLQQFLRRDDIYQRYGNVWFRGNDGHETVASLLTDPVLLQRLYTPTAARQIQPEEVRLPAKYLQFLDSLAYAHCIDFGQDGRALRFAFCHGLLHCPAGASSEPETEVVLPVEEQLALRTYEQFHAYRRDRQVWIEHLHVWNRNATAGRYGDFILVHGHTPTVLLNRFHDDLGTYDVASGLPYLRFARRSVAVHAKSKTQLVVGAGLDDLASIDVDTGAVYGKCLTALLLDEEALFSHATIGALQVRMDCAHRHGEDIRQVEFRFG